jgi:hypothetical protein
MVNGQWPMVNARCRGVVLLEILLALALFIAAATVVGSAMRGSASATMDMKFDAQAVNLAESIISELQCGALQLNDLSATAFEEGPEGWTYEIAAQGMQDTPALKRVTVTIRNTAEERSFSITQLMLDPAALPGGNAPAAEEAPQ